MRLNRPSSSRCLYTLLALLPLFAAADGSSQSAVATDSAAQSTPDTVAEIVSRSSLESWALLPSAIRSEEVGEGDEPEHEPEQEQELPAQQGRLDLRQVANPNAATPAVATPAAGAATPVATTPAAGAATPVVATPAVATKTATPAVAKPVAETPAVAPAVAKTTVTPPGAAPVAAPTAKTTATPPAAVPAPAGVIPPPAIDPNAPASVVTQVSPVTTYMAQEYVAGAAAPKEVQVVYSQVFAVTPDQWKAPRAGQVGLGKIQGKVGVVKADKKKKKMKRDAEAEPEAYLVLPEAGSGSDGGVGSPVVKRAAGGSGLKKRKGGKAGSDDGDGESAAVRIAGPITSSIMLFAVGLVAVVAAGLV